MSQRTYPHNNFFLAKERGKKRRKGEKKKNGNGNAFISWIARH